MIVDLKDSTLAALPDVDVCVVGSGPAGMTLARELQGTGLAVCVLESGKLRPTRLGDELRKVRSEGIHIKDYSRERVLGGASTTWAGLSSPLDAVDLDVRPHLRMSAWPLRREQLVPYWEQAARRYRFAPLSLYEPDGFGVLRDRGDVQLSWKELEEKIFLAAAEPQDFGREFRDVFESGGVDLYLDATVIRLDTHEGEPRVARAVVRTSSGREFGLVAQAFVLATGGIENARLLLNSRSLCTAGLGNERDVVGRYLMNHPKNYYGVLHLNRPVRELPYHFGCLFQGYAGYAGLRLSDAVQAEQGLLNAYVRFEPLYPWSDSRGVEALVFLVKRSRRLLRGFQRRHQGKVVSMRDYSETGDDSDLQNERKTALDWIQLVGLVLVHVPSVLRYVIARLREGSAPSVRAIRLRNFMEMAPDPDNRVVLGEEIDPYGQPVPVVRHQSGELDRRSLIALHQALAEEVEHSGFGTLESHLEDERPWPVDLDASHHLGATRMGTDPATSVVDPDCRVHSVQNLYLAGGSVFPSSGCANPTFTIVALSIRLAEHLKSSLRPRTGAPRQEEAP